MKKDEDRLGCPHPMITRAQVRSLEALLLPTVQIVTHVALMSTHPEILDWSDARRGVFDDGRPVRTA